MQELQNKHQYIHSQKVTKNNKQTKTFLKKTGRAKKGKSTNERTLITKNLILHVW